MGALSPMSTRTFEPPPGILHAKVISFFPILSEFAPVDGYAFPYELRARRQVGLGFAKVMDQKQPKKCPSWQRAMRISEMSELNYTSST